MTSLVLMS